ncbi:hypothetical protein QYF61_021606 [Mycteria americana]|uniref:Uncharacterized protein n=1 Tax=Mycteria americana TaxID=33587 RepID=A0AAN7NXY6_MYCAM|nr:hypothetical protein QYF61_021606 [Mycteria americana]
MTERERVRELGWFSPKKRRLRGILLLSPATSWEVTEMVEPDSFQRCTKINHQKDLMRVMRHLGPGHIVEIHINLAILDISTALLMHIDCLILQGLSSFWGLQDFLLIFTGKRLTDWFCELTWELRFEETRELMAVFSIFIVVVIVSSA